jgi:hypothetical protein
VIAQSTWKKFTASTVVAWVRRNWRQLGRCRQRLDSNTSSLPTYPYLHYASAVSCPQDSSPAASWDRLDVDDQRALFAGVHTGQVPPTALALYARWWQFETWIRSLVYVELRAQYGDDWTSHAVDAGRQQKDERHPYMLTPDQANRLAYLDARALLELTDREWPLFARTLLEESDWVGDRDRLLKIRNRIGHLRRPHADDLPRLEQTLRDLEPGARVALLSHVDRQDPRHLDIADPMVAAWVHRRHESAQRLIDHAREQYATRFALSYTVRPYATVPPAGSVLSGTPGILWRADFVLQGRYLYVDDLWGELSESTRSVLVHVLIANLTRVAVTFPAVCDGSAVANALGDVFEAVVATSNRSFPGDIGDISDDPLARVPPLDGRVQIQTAWAQPDDVALPTMLFEAGP